MRTGARHSATCAIACRVVLSRVGGVRKRARWNAFVTGCHWGPRGHRRRALPQLASRLFEAFRESFALSSYGAPENPYKPLKRAAMKGRCAFEGAPRVTDWECHKGRADVYSQGHEVRFLQIADSRAHGQLPFVMPATSAIGCNVAYHKRYL